MSDGEPGQDRIGEPDEVARVIAWLLSGEASFVNGEVMSIGGGDGTPRH